MPEEVYCVDTSSLIALKQDLPADVFPGVWQKIDGLIQSKRLISTREVLREIESGHDELVTWAKTRKRIFLNPDVEELETVKDILRNFRLLVDAAKQGSHADPFVVAQAKVRNDRSSRQLLRVKHIVVTQESKTNPNKIPRVCAHYQIDSVNLLELFRREKWQF